MGQPIYGYVCDGYWQDIGNLDQYRQANFDALDEKVRLSIGGMKIRGDVWVGAGVEIDDVENVEGPAFIGNYCTVSPESSIGPYTVLGPGCTLRERGDGSRAAVDRRVPVTSAAARSSRARSSVATATCARTRACTRASRSATR